MNPRLVTSAAAVVIALAATVACEATWAQQAVTVSRSSVIQPKGGGIGNGPLKSIACDANDVVCRLPVRASLGPLDDFANVDQRECIIRVPVSAVFASGRTKRIRWALTPGTQQRGFSFPDTDAVVIDDGGLYFETPTTVDSNTAVVAVLKSGVKTWVSSYTLNLRWKSPTVPGQDITCVGLDPIIVNADN